MEIYKVKGDTSLKMVTFIKGFSQMVHLMDRHCLSPRIFSLLADSTIMRFKAKSR